MIYDRIENFNLYLSMHGHFADVLRFMEEVPLAGREDGRYKINEHGAYVAIDTYETQDIKDCFIECHRKYIDVQVMISGIERVGVCHRSSCAALLYSEENDFQKLTGDTDLLALGVVSFMIFYPDDAHMPKVRYGTAPEMVRKAVFKVPVL